ncbi:MAG TPA: hypothetical protein VNH11_21165 [Pirellulales bacterium]|nr:hypothetical protein [Pirellulales bacterium]
MAIFSRVLSSRRDGLYFAGCLAGKVDRHPAFFARRGKINFGIILFIRIILVEVWQ